MLNERLLKAYLTRKIRYSEIIEEAREIGRATGEEKAVLQNKLAEKIENTYPLKKVYQTEK
ncbi:MAG: hypothetical protein IKH57_17535 [Clostridia bacterium]|nr:hypothetical protein [Clostridia bacterium]